MLEKLAAIANTLDAHGLYDDANKLTNIMVRMSEYFDNEEGPINDFNALDSLGLNNDNTDLLRIHAVLRNNHIDPNGMTDEAATQVYQAIMGNQIMSYANNNQPRIKKIG